jgi:Delta 1-pyrroline-5-carboxylate dehydrogenase
MSFGYFSYPMPVNETILSYAPGSTERELLRSVLEKLKNEEADIPMYIGSKEVRTNKRERIHPPHELKHTLGYHSVGDEKHIHQAIEAALAAKEAWAGMSWEGRANIFLKAADLISTKYRPYMNGTTMLGQSKSVFQAEIDSACEVIDFLRLTFIS